MKNQLGDLSQSKIEKYFKLYLLYILYWTNYFSFQSLVYPVKWFNYLSYDNNGEAEIKKKK